MTGGALRSALLLSPASGSEFDAELRYRYARLGIAGIGDRAAFS
jgi:hypothetical protein